MSAIDFDKSIERERVCLKGVLGLMYFAPSIFLAVPTLVIGLIIPLKQIILGKPLAFPIDLLWLMLGFLSLALLVFLFQRSRLKMEKVHVSGKRSEAFKALLNLANQEAWRVEFKTHNVLHFRARNFFKGSLGYEIVVLAKGDGLLIKSFTNPFNRSRVTFGENTKHMALLKDSLSAL